MKNLFIFVAGALAGAAGAYVYTKGKYEQIMEEEIQSVRDIYREKQKQDKKEEPEQPEEPSDEMVKEDYKDIVKENKYVNYTNYMDNEEVKSETEEIEPTDFPYVIDPEEFGEEVGYDTTTYTYFSDGVLVDDVDDVVDDPEIMVGLENLKIFEETGCSGIYVRNEIYKMDIEILKDDWKWSDIEDAENKRIEKMKQERENYKHLDQIEENKKPHQI